MDGGIKMFGMLNYRLFTILAMLILQACCLIFILLKKQKISVCFIILSIALYIYTNWNSIFGLVLLIIK